ncbi:MAG: pentapeptide repeat-containing protein [Solirubrobacterales bacterium]
MPRRQPDPEEIGAAQAPDLVSAALEWTNLEALEPEFELEGVRIAGAELRQVEAGAGRLAAAQLEDVDLDGAQLHGVALVDVLADRLGAANGEWRGATLRRAVLTGSRLTGLDLGESRLEDVVLRDCKLDYANLRHAAIEHVTFSGCVLSGADFQGARLRAVRFEDCRLSEADFSRAELEAVDFRSSQLALAGSLLGLRGAIVDSLQLMELSRPLATELGISVRDE